jgi:hypothetical protein
MGANRISMLLTTDYAQARDAAAASASNPAIEASWFGIEAIDDINKVPGHLVVKT